ncbi:expressed unknown protein [Seminavis robusta]|uniref:Uncharacterized protein n=1 Tax=Seminavis robusta TaxID=568900 RepID=A0A9N8EB60_9STRA|nr:expressed unknown protein [Seminavis robusta]|eukprot:Sro752_g197250.1 n/a (239) ;mRNA; r:45106-46070
MSNVRQEQPRDANVGIHDGAFADDSEKSVRGEVTVIVVDDNSDEEDEKQDEKQKTIPLLVDGGNDKKASKTSADARELHWGLNVKDAVKRLPDLDPLSDFMYAHLGIASKGDVEWAIDRAYKMQHVRRKYKIRGTYEEGTKAIRKMMERLPRQALSFTFNPHSGKVVMVMDTAESLTGIFKDQKSEETVIRGCFYACYAMFPSFECVRVGNTIIGDEAFSMPSFLPNSLRIHMRHFLA